ncbi:MAG: hypothetical protein CMC93_05795 [Flavobacteriaceae bacterium]|nr:hypothetical protein [Flavobacteriaceae bacterium]|tara:strand:+ start:278 stop:457 length:180 start_codon:yes stop_codon:yes gene_type:complete
MGHLCLLYAFVRQHGFKWPFVAGVLLIGFSVAIIFLCYDNLGALFIPVLFYIGEILMKS